MTREICMAAKYHHIREEIDGYTVAGTISEHNANCWSIEFEVVRTVASSYHSPKIRHVPLRPTLKQPMRSRERRVIVSPELDKPCPATMHLLRGRCRGPRHWARRCRASFRQILHRHYPARKQLRTETMLDPFQVAQAFVDSPLPGSLQTLLDAVDVERY